MIKGILHLLYNRLLHSIYILKSIIECGKSVISQDIDLIASIGLLDYLGLDVSGTIIYCLALFSFTSYTKSSVCIGGSWSTVQSDLNQQQQHTELQATMALAHEGGP